MLGLPPNPWSRSFLVGAIWTFGSIRGGLRLRVPFTVPAEAKSLQLNEVQKSNLAVLWTFRTARWP